MVMLSPGRGGRGRRTRCLLQPRGLICSSGGFKSLPGEMRSRREKKAPPGSVLERRWVWAALGLAPQPPGAGVPRGGGTGLARLSPFYDSMILFSPQSCWAGSKRDSGAGDVTTSSSPCLRSLLGAGDERQRNRVLRGQQREVSFPRAVRATVGIYLISSPPNKP